MRFAIGFRLSAALLLPLGFAHAEPTDDSLRLYAVNIGTNYGVYLGNGLVITAAHVLDSASHTEPIVGIAGTDLPAEIIRRSPYERMDLMLLSVDEQKLPARATHRLAALSQNVSHATYRRGASTVSHQTHDRANARRSSRRCRAESR